MINEHGTKHDTLLYWLYKDRKEIVKKIHSDTYHYLLYCLVEHGQIDAA